MQGLVQFNFLRNRCSMLHERRQGKEGENKGAYILRLISMTGIHSYCVSSFSFLDSHSNGRWSSGKVSPGDGEEKWNTLCEHATPRCSLRPSNQPTEGCSGSEPNLLPFSVYHSLLLFTYMIQWSNGGSFKTV